MLEVLFMVMIVGSVGSDNATEINTSSITRNQSVTGMPTTATENINSTAETNSTGLSGTTEHVTQSTNYSVLPWQPSTPNDSQNMTIVETTEASVSTETGNNTSLYVSMGTLGNSTTNYTGTPVPVVKSTPYEIIQDIDEGFVAGMSVCVVLIFGACFGLAVFKHVYRKRSRKDERGVLYEEVEDAATSCSIEGSSNIKFLVGRARNINKSRIDQINEEWKKDKPNLTQENGIKENGRKISTPDQSQTDRLRKFSVDSEKNSGRIDIEEDSEYATAEPEEDLYSLAGDAVSESTSENTELNSPPPVPDNKRPSIKKLNRASAFDDEDEDPYEETPEGEYDMVHSPRAHKPPKAPCLSERSEASETNDDEHMYEMTDDVSYDGLVDTRKKLEGIHRSKAQQVLYRKSKSSLPDSNNIYQDSFEDEYDVLNKPRFRLTGSSDNYDNVVLPFESEEPVESTTENTNDSLVELEIAVRIESNIYSAMPVNDSVDTDYYDKVCDTYIKDVSDTKINAVSDANSDDVSSTKMTAVTSANIGDGSGTQFNDGSGANVYDSSGTKINDGSSTSINGGSVTKINDGSGVTINAVFGANIQDGSDANINDGPVECINQTSTGNLHDTNHNGKSVDDEKSKGSEILNLFQHCTSNDRTRNQSGSASSHSSICDVLANFETPLSTCDVENQNLFFVNQCYETFLKHDTIEPNIMNSESGNVKNNELDGLIDDVDKVK